MGSTQYADNYRTIDFRKHPEKYIIGRGEQGVLIAEPYKSEILPHWKFATPQKAEQSAKQIYKLFTGYKKARDFVGMDMARKFLQMGFTRSRRYANHASGNKYDSNGAVKPQDENSEDSKKAQSAQIFKIYYDKVRQDADYLMAKSEHQAKQKEAR